MARLKKRGKSCKEIVENIISVLHTKMAPVELVVHYIVNDVLEEHYKTGESTDVIFERKIKELKHEKANNQA